MDATLEHHDLPVVDLDQVAQRLDAHPVRVGELHRVEQLAAFRAEHVLVSGSTPSLAITACTCALSPLRSCTNLAR